MRMIFIDTPPEPEPQPIYTIEMPLNVVYLTLTPIADGKTVDISNASNIITYDETDDSWDNFTTKTSSSFSKSVDVTRMDVVTLNKWFAD